MTSDSTLLRLRTANPVPRQLDPPPEASDLFAQIISLPPDPAERTRPYRRPLLVFAVALVVVALLASTAFAISQWVGGAVGPHVTKGEYRRAQHELTLPPGLTWPALHVDPHSVTSPGAGGGHAVLVAQNAWQCYWVRAIGRRDAAAERQAQDELNALLRNNIIVAPAGASENWAPPNPPTGPYAIFADDGGLAWIRGAYEEAAAGHPERLAQACRANAPG